MSNFFDENTLVLLTENYEIWKHIDNNSFLITEKINATGPNGGVNITVKISEFKKWMEKSLQSNKESSFNYEIDNFGGMFSRNDFVKFTLGKEDKLERSLTIESAGLIFVRYFSNNELQNIVDNL